MRIFVVALLLAATAAAQDPSELNFLSSHTDYRNLRSMLPDYTTKRAFELLDKRRAASANWTAAEISGRKQYLREHMLRGIGGLPERTPLNARVTGVIDREDYRIEKIIFESRPNFFVTANLYLPKRGQGPYPAVLYPLGHEEGAKAHVAWQQMLVTLARNGYVGLAWDGPGQGERVQLYDPDFNSSKVFSSTLEHTILGIQTLLVGDALAQYYIWDGMRALDYLLSRPEVDPKRVACSGNSGGGTLTAYLSALDDRIQVAAPSCYITSWRRLLETIGPQDAEQCIPNWISDGLDHEDFLLSFAPKPYLQLSAIRDFFSITGARETNADATRAYDRLGAGDKMRFFQADDGHGFTKPRRLAAYAWFDRWLKKAEFSGVEDEVLPLREEELYCTPTGQVASSLGGETVTTLNQKRAKQFQRGQATPAQIAKLIDYHQPTGPLSIKPFGTLTRGGYRIEKLVYETEPGIVIPALLFVPDSAGKHPGVLYVDGAGKAAHVADIEALVKAGHVVLSIDARGLGETRIAAFQNGSDWFRYFGDWNSGMTAIMMGSTLTGQRAADISRGLDVLAARGEVDAGRLYGVGVEAGGVPLLHAAVLDSRLRKIALERTLISYQAVVDARIHRGLFEQVVPGALKLYDLPDLVRMLGQRSAAVIDAVNPLGQPAPLTESRKTYPSAARRAAADSIVALYKF
ncbi:alpha/beta hydrolase [Paludibaculum fermentans]|uniref:Acetylxylan esterase n=1 Tax=Paludibaculum fermentans TaxID=1473598 RepID=A0A7S7NNH8_PALFE|nr:acetylxylan esterase [Paludibaculum fermentans]QOY86891.1 acetylxylan esterase [Paludibaculum fermentans]